MAFTYDLSTSRGQVRLLARDSRASEYLFEDAEIDAFLTLNSSNVRRAAADALDVMASDEAMVQKVIKLLDLQTNGAQTAKALRDHANKLRELADTEAAYEEGGFDIAENPVDPFSDAEYAWKEAVRAL